MEFYKVDLDSIFALVLIFGLIPSFVLTAVIQYLKNRRYKIERQTELMAKMIEKGAHREIGEEFLCVLKIF